MKGFSREELEAEMALRFLARANPPPILFRYRRPSDWTIDEISYQFSDTLHGGGGRD